MAAVGYVPNLVARSLASARTRTIGVLVPTIANAIFADTVQRLTDEVEPRGYTVILAQSRYDDAQQARMLMALLSRRPEALVMVGLPAKPASVHLLRRAGIPVVETWDLPARPIDAVAGFDNRAAGIIVARHFAGRREAGRLAFVGGDDPRATRRWKGFRAASVEAGLPAPRRLVVGRNAGASALAALTLPGDVDAIFRCERLARDRLAGPVGSRYGRNAHMNGPSRTAGACGNLVRGRPRTVDATTLQS